MSRLSNDTARVLAELGEVTQAYQSAVDDYDREIARLLGVNETDLRCLELLIVSEERSPRELSVQLGLTTGSVTAMLDRLEKHGLLVRSPHPVDRRRTVVTLTSHGTQRCSELIAPLVADGEKELSATYSAEQLQLVTDFLRSSTAVQVRHTHRLRALPAPRRRTPSRRAEG